MNRVKFLVFALVAIGLFAWSLKLAPSLGADRSVADASLGLAGTPSAVALKLEGRRSELQALTLKLAASPAVTNVGPKAPKPEAPTVDRFNAVRATVTESMSDELKGGLVVLISNEAGALLAKAEGEPAAPEGLDVAAITTGGAAGSIASINGVPHLFFAVPLLASDRNEVKPVGSAAIGAPLIGDGRELLGGVRKDLGLAGIALLSDGAVVALDGDKATLEAAVKSVKVGPIVELPAEPVTSVGPLALPMMSSLTQQLALRRQLSGTPYEVVAIASSAEALVALAGFQKFGLGALVGLLLLSIAVMALLKSGEEEGATMVLPPPVMPVAPVRVSTSSGLLAPTSTVDEPLPHAPEASPDDFHFPGPTTQPVQAPKSVTAQEPAYVPPPVPDAEPTADPFATLGPAPSAPSYPAPAPVAAPHSKPPPPVTANVPAYQPPPPPPAPLQVRPAPVSNPFDDEEGARTQAYPIFKTPGANPNAPPPGFDPFAMAASHEADAGQVSEPNPDATRVAAVPAELLRAAKQSAPSGHTGERPSLSRAAAPKVTSVIGAAGALDEERHFQDVFREFVATREKCGEPADGLTYDKFKAKLVKNKEQLVAKYSCKSVRFQVYVKDNKAALKATPVKD